MPAEPGVFATMERAREIGGVAAVNSTPFIDLTMEDVMWDGPLLDLPQQHLPEELVSQQLLPRELQSQRLQSPRV
ncbi:unnamed protein product [Calypogeia fissa]